MVLPPAYNAQTRSVGLFITTFLPYIGILKALMFVFGHVFFCDFPLELGAFYAQIAIQSN